MKSRSAGLSTLGWVFGMAVSVLLLALWGRSVVADTETLADSLSPLAGSGFVVDYMADWMSAEMVDSGADPATVQPTVEYFFQTSSVADTLDSLVGEMVHAAASSDPQGSQIDMAALIGPSVPELTVGLGGLGYPVTERTVGDVVQGFDPLVIRNPGSPALVGPESPAAARLGTAALLAVLVMIVAGMGIVSLSDDRVGAIRSLMTRVALGGLSFAVFLRLGSWVLDPQGGRAPVPETLSALAASKWSVPLRIALAAAMLAGGIYVGRRALRRVAGSRRPNGRSRPQQELEESLSGSR